MSRLTRVLRSATSSAEPPYLPEAGDIIGLTFDPQAGREQAGRRPALVLSPASYNGPSRLCILCPITSELKGYPFETAIPDGLLVQGAVLSDQVKSLSWSDRGSQFIGRMPVAVLADVRAKIKALLQIQS
jgi:mRNA interferase MazF